MKNLLISISVTILSLFALGCKNDDVNPDVVSEIIGTYHVDSLYKKGVVFPSMTAGVGLDRKSNNSVYFVEGVTFKSITGITDPVEFQIKRSDTGYIVMQNDRQVGTIEKAHLKLTITTEDGRTTYLEGTKQ